MNMMHCPLVTLLLSLVALPSVGCAANEAGQRAANARDIERTTTALIAAADADSLAAASLMAGWKKDTAWRLTLIARAVASAPDRPDLVWLNLQLCSAVESCDPQPLEAQLHALDPGNGAAWSVSIARFARLGDTAAVRKDILAIANSERFDIYWNEMIVHTANAVLKVHTLDPSTAIVGAIGSAAALAIPAYQQISNACKGESLTDVDVLATCRKVSSVMRHGDTYITEMIGVAIAKRVWPEGSADYQGAVDARRLARYRMDTDAKRSTAHLWNNAYAEKYLHLLATYRTEQEVVFADLTNAGLSPTPPPDWTDAARGRH